MFAQSPHTSRARRPRPTSIAGTRPPTDPERVAARRVGRALSTAGVRDRVRTHTASAMPPGRLRMRGALAAAAQRAAGAVPTALPFTRTTRTTVPTPPLRLGIACDVSGSMVEFAGVAWSATSRRARRNSRSESLARSFSCSRSETNMFSSGSTAVGTRSPRG